MAIGPIDYTSTMPELDVRPLYMLADQLRQRKAIAEQREQQEAAQMQLQGEIEQLGANFTPQALTQFNLKYPQLADAASKGWEAYDEGRKNQNLKDMTGVASALQADRLDLAKKLLGERKTALVASGEQTTETEALESILDKVEQAKASGNEVEAARLGNQARGIIAFGLSSALGEKATPVLERLGFGGDSAGKVVGYGDAIVDPSTGRIIYQAPDAPFTLGEGETRFGGVRQPSGGDAGSSGGAPSRPGTPITLRTNNPGAIKDGNYARSLPGYTGSEGGFAKFASPAAGAAAHKKLLRDNYLAKGFNTPRKIVERYAPRGENSDAAVDNYIGRIAKGLGIGPDDRIATESLPQLANIMASVESGIGNPKGGDPTAGAVASVPKTKEPSKPSDTRSVGGKVYVKIDGQWFQKGR